MRFDAQFTSRHFDFSCTYLFFKSNILVFVTYWLKHNSWQLFVFRIKFVKIENHVHLHHLHIVLLTSFVFVRVETYFSNMFNLVANITLIDDDQFVNNRIVTLNNELNVKVNCKSRKRNRCNEFHKKYKNWNCKNKFKLSILKAKQTCNFLFDSLFFYFFLLL